MKKTIASLLVISLSALFSACIFDSEDEGWSAAKVCPVSKRGTFTDERDGRVYKYTTIGKQVWMAENLNYNTSGGNTCYYGQDGCASIGFVYTSKVSFAFEGGICPIGWHVPSIDEWRSLIANVGGDGIAGLRLKSTDGWRPLNPGDQSNGTDDCGFSAKAAMSYSQDKGMESRFLAEFTGNPDAANEDVFTVSFVSLDNEVRYSYQPYNFMSGYVRCVKD